jgi:uncharacterized protein (TIGR00369 family)
MAERFNRAGVDAFHTGTPFARWLGIELLDAGPGWCETRLAVRDEHRQQTGVVHAGVLATLADHAAGAAGTTLLAPEQTLVSVEFKIALLRAASTPSLCCRAEVLKAGRRIIVAEADVLGEDGSDRRLVAKFAVTLMPVDTGR